MNISNISQLISQPSVSQLSKPQFESFGKGGQFMDRRGLDQYISSSHESFSDSLGNLQKDQLWLDVGCGSVRALQDYIQRYPEGGQAIGITILRPDDSEESEQFKKADRTVDRLHLYLGDFLTFSNEINHQVSLITDIYGAFQYAGKLDSTLKKMSEILHPEGKAFIAFAFARCYVNSVTVAYPNDSSKNNQKMDADMIFLWLKTVKGFEVTINQVGSKTNKSSAIVLTRTSEPFQADPFYIKESLEVPDKKSIFRRIGEAFSQKSLIPFKNRTMWEPPNNEFSYDYNYIWEVSENNLPYLE